MASINMKVVRKRALTGQISEFTMEPIDGGTLPAFTPGAHVTVQTPSGAMRRYSLVGSGEAPSSYTIAVKREPESRGGSASMHDNVEEGTELVVEEPENDFELSEANEYLLIAGGIGVTPIYSMAQELERQNKRFNIIYVTRSAGDTAYLDEMTEAFGDRILIHHDDGDPERSTTSGIISPSRRRPMSSAAGPSR